MCCLLLLQNDFKFAMMHLFASLSTGAVFPIGAAAVISSCQHR